MSFSPVAVGAVSLGRGNEGPPSHNAPTATARLRFSYAHHLSVSGPESKDTAAAALDLVDQLMADRDDDGASALLNKVFPVCQTLDTASHLRTLNIAGCLASRRAAAVPPDNASPASERRRVLELQERLVQAGVSRHQNAGRAYYAEGDCKLAERELLLGIALCEALRTALRSEDGFSGLLPLQNGAKLCTILAGALHAELGYFLSRNDPSGYSRALRHYAQAKVELGMSGASPRRVATLDMGTGDIQFEMGDFAAAECAYRAASSGFATPSRARGVLCANALAHVAKVLLAGGKQTVAVTELRAVIQDPIRFDSASMPFAVDFFGVCLEFVERGITNSSDEASILLLASAALQHSEQHEIHRDACRTRLRATVGKISAVSTVASTPADLPSPASGPWTTPTSSTPRITILR